MHLSIDQPRHTARTRLRGITAADLDDLFAYRSLPSIFRYIPGEPMTREQVQDAIATRWARRSIDNEGEGVRIGIELVSSGHLIGDMSLWVASVHDSCGEIGWILNPTFTGQGFATEAAHGVLHLAFYELGLRRVIARVDARNIASLRLATRLGMRQEAHLVENELFKGELTDEIDFALLSREFEALPHSTQCLI